MENTDKVIKKTVEYPFWAADGMEKFDVVLDRESATGVLSVGLLSRYGMGHYYPVTCNEEKMPYCQAVIERDSERFGRDLPQILAENGLGRILGESQEPGFRGYTVFQFDPDVLRGIDPAVFADYEQAAGIHQKSPIAFERRNIDGVEWRVAVQETGGRQVPLAASALGNPDAPVLVVPEKDSFALILQGESPQSYETMKQAIQCANKHILSMPERDAYLVPHEGEEGIYQPEGGGYSINAFWSNTCPGYIQTEILDTYDVDRGADKLPFDDDPNLYELHDGFTSIEECVRHVAEKISERENLRIEFVAPCDHHLETVGDYRHVMKAASKDASSLDDLKQEAKERADEKNANRPEQTNNRKPPAPER